MNRSLYVSQASDLHCAWEMHNGVSNGYNWEAQQQVMQEPPQPVPQPQQLVQQHQNVGYGGFPNQTQYLLQGSNTGFLHGCMNTASPQNAAVYNGAGFVLYGEPRGLPQSHQRSLLGFLENHNAQNSLQAYVDPKQYQVKSDDLYGRIGLNLGVRTYFSSEDALMRLAKRPRAESPIVQAPLCQAEGCKADLSSAKHYHRRHKVCELHSKAATVTANGQTQRFCQQCSRFHPLGEFDEGKRSCRKRLADHNRRRRKPQPAASSEPKEGENEGAQEEEKPVPGSPASCSDSKSDDVSQQRASCTRTEENGAHSTLLADKVTSTEDKAKNTLTNEKYGLTENVGGTDRDYMSSNVKGTEENYLRLSSDHAPWSKPEAPVQVLSAPVHGLATCRPYLAPQPFDCNTADSMGSYGVVYGVMDRELS